MDKDVIVRFNLSSSLATLLMAGSIVFAGDPVTPPAPAPSPAPSPAPTPAPAPKPEPKLEPVGPPAPVVAPEAKAVITLLDGTEVPKTWPVGKSLVLTAEKSTAGTFRWSLSPGSFEGLSQRTGNGQVLSVGTGAVPAEVKIRLLVAKGDTLDELVIPIKFEATFEPDPAPAPVPPAPKPAPAPPAPQPVPPPAPVVYTPPVALIEGDAIVSVGTDIFLDAGGSVATPSNAIIWKWKGDPVIKPSYRILKDADDRPTILWLRKPKAGRYRFEVIVRGQDKDGSAISDADLIDVVVPDPVPPQPPAPPVPPPVPPPTPVPPTPPPTPPVPPGPDPIVGPIYATYVFDVADKAEETLAIRSDATITATLLGIDAHWHAFAVDSDDVTTLNLKSFVDEAGGAPVVLIQNKAGKVVGTVKAPKSAAAVVDQIKLRRAK